MQISEDWSRKEIDILKWKKKTERTIQEISTIINLSSEKYKGVQRVRQSYWSHVEEILEPRDAENNPLVLNAFGHLSNMHAAINQEFLR